MDQVSSNNFAVSSVAMIFGGHCFSGTLAEDKKESFWSSDCESSERTEFSRKSSLSDRFSTFEVAPAVL